MSLLCVFHLTKAITHINFTAFIDKISLCYSQDDQLRDIIDRSREMEEVFGHLFDFVLVNSDLSRAYTDLLEEINRIEMEPQWVPASWIGS